MIDLAKLPAMPGAAGFIHTNEDGPAYWMQNVLWIMLADANDTGGRWSMMEQEMPMGVGPPPHKHLWSDETFYILDGTITFLIGTEIRTASKGAFICVPRATTHAFRVDSDTARILNGYTPASWEAFIAENGKRTERRELPERNLKQVGGAGQFPDEFVVRYGLQWLDEPDPLEPRRYRWDRADG